VNGFTSLPKEGMLRVFSPEKHLEKTGTDTQMKFYKPPLLYGSEKWVTTKRDMTCLEAAEMRFRRSANP
jgi:hypothetical protein